MRESLETRRQSTVCYGLSKVSSDNPVEESKIVRFAKKDVLEWFDRQDRSYRLALLCTYWIRDTADYKPSASE